MGDWTTWQDDEVGTEPRAVRRFAPVMVRHPVRLPSGGLMTRWSVRYEHQGQVRETEEHATMLDAVLAARFRWSS